MLCLGSVENERGGRHCCSCCYTSCLTLTTTCSNNTEISHFGCTFLRHRPPPSPSLRATIPQRYADSRSSSDSETGGDDSREATVRQSPRRAPAVERRPSPPSPLPSPSLPISQTPAPPIAGGTAVASRDLEREERERGNAKFGRGKFDEAIKSYTRWVSAWNGGRC